MSAESLALSAEAKAPKLEVQTHTRVKCLDEESQMSRHRRVREELKPLDRNLRLTPGTLPSYSVVGFMLISASLSQSTFNLDAHNMSIGGGEFNNTQGHRTNLTIYVNREWGSVSQNTDHFVILIAKLPSSGTLYLLRWTPRMHDSRSDTEPT